jgi:hypothetical protein
VAAAAVRLLALEQAVVGTQTKEAVVAAAQSQGSTQTTAATRYAAREVEAAAVTRARRPRSRKTAAQVAQPEPFSQQAAAAALEESELQV